MAGERLDNGRRLLPGATPLGVATYMNNHGKWVDNNGDPAPVIAGTPAAKYAKPSEAKDPRELKDKKAR